MNVEQKTPFETHLDTLKRKASGMVNELFVTQQILSAETLVEKTKKLNEVFQSINILVSIEAQHQKQVAEESKIIKPAEMSIIK